MSCTFHSAQLLTDRKHNPTEKWRNELPYKAKKLEEQLYKTAPSLEDYLDKDTLKDRLKHVARAITSQYKLARKNPVLPKSKRMSKRGSDSSFGSIGSIPWSQLPQNGVSAYNASGDGNAIFDVSGDLASLERQKQASAKLVQANMLENIRNQQIILKVSIYVLIKSLNKK